MAVPGTDSFSPSSVLSRAVPQEHGPALGLGTAPSPNTPVARSSGSASSIRSRRQGGGVGDVGSVQAPAAL